MGTMVRSRTPRGGSRSERKADDPVTAALAEAQRLSAWALERLRGRRADEVAEPLAPWPPGSAVAARIVPIGNSRGVRIPKPLLEETGLEGEVELVAVDDSIVIRPARTVRQGWDEAFAGMAAHGDDALLDPDLTGGDGWDEGEWEW